MEETGMNYATTNPLRKKQGDLWGKHRCVATVMMRYFNTKRHTDGSMILGPLSCLAQKFCWKAIGYVAKKRCPKQFIFTCVQSGVLHAESLGDFKDS